MNSFSLPGFQGRRVARLEARIGANPYTAQAYQKVSGIFTAPSNFFGGGVSPCRSTNEKARPSRAFEQELNAQALS